MIPPKWWHLAGTAWVVVHVGCSQLFLFFLLRPVLKVLAPGSADDRLRRATRWMARGVVSSMPFGRVDYQNISKDTFTPPCIVISNHQSAADVMLMVSLPGDVRQTAKKRVFDSPLLGIGCKVLGHIMVEPNDPATTLGRCRDALAAGASVHFYPEGTRSHDGAVQRFHRGAFDLAVELNLDVLPVVICDSRVAMPRDAYWFEPFRANVRAWPRITPETFDYSAGPRALMNHCHGVVRASLQRQLDEVNTPPVVRRKTCRAYRRQRLSVRQFVSWKTRLDPMFLVLDNVVPRRGTIVDLGCGVGIAVHWLGCLTDERSFVGIDYDERKVQVAQHTAAGAPRTRFVHDDILNAEFPECDAILLLDVLHYWPPDIQQRILTKAERSLRPGGRLILRDAERSNSPGHRRVHRWESFATWTGMNRTREGLHFLTANERNHMLKSAGFGNQTAIARAGNGSNVMTVAKVSRR